MRHSKDGAFSALLGDRAVLAILVSLIVVSVVVPTGAAIPAGADSPLDKRVTLIADSVGLGVQDHLHEQFPDDWDVSVIGRRSISIPQLEQRFVRPDPSRFGGHVVVAAGYNFPFENGLAASIDSMIDTLTDAGVEHVYWVTLRELRSEIVTDRAWEDAQRFFWYFPLVNAALDEALARHPQLTLIDWSAAADRPGLTTDAIHLDEDGIELYGSLIRRAIDDTASRPPNGGVTRVNVASRHDVASGDVTAVALNLTSVRGRDAGYVSASPCEEDPQTSNLNHRRDAVVAAAAIVSVGASGDICVHNQQAGHIVVDVFGWFGSDADLLDAEATRALDTRDGWPLLGETEHPVTVVEPGIERTVVLNVTAVRPLDAGYATVHVCGEGPGETSNVNFVRAATQPNLVVARTDASGQICLTTTATTHVLVDVLAVLGPESTVVAATPARLTDTRVSDTSTEDGTVVIDVPAAMNPSEGGIVANLTIAGARTSGYAAAYPCAGGRPGTSNINFGPNTAVANAVVLEPDDDGRVCVFTSVDAEVILDLMGTTGSGFVGIAPTRLADSRENVLLSD